VCDQQGLYTPLLVYAVGFNVIPLVRWFKLREKNKEIERRNEARRTWAGEGGHGDRGPMIVHLDSMRIQRLCGDAGERPECWVSGHCIHLTHPRHSTRIMCASVSVLAQHRSTIAMTITDSRPML
jgi:hypothetical protein